MKMIKIYQKFFNKGILSTKSAFIRWLWWKIVYDETDGNTNKSFNMIIKSFGNFRLLIRYLQLYYVKQEKSANWNEHKTIQTNKNQKTKRNWKSKPFSRSQPSWFQEHFLRNRFSMFSQVKDTMVQFWRFDILISHNYGLKNKKEQGSWWNLRWNLVYFHLTKGIHFVARTLSIYIMRPCITCTNRNFWRMLLLYSCIFQWPNFFLLYHQRFPPSFGCLQLYLGSINLC